MTTFQDVVKFILDNRRDKAFHNWTEEQISDAIYESASRNELAVCFDDSGNIIGLAHGFAFPAKNLFHVSNLLVKKDEVGVVKTLMKKFDELFPGYKLEGTRYGNIKQYDMARFNRHVKNIT